MSTTVKTVWWFSVVGCPGLECGQKYVWWWPGRRNFDGDVTGFDKAFLSFQFFVWPPFLGGFLRPSLVQFWGLVLGFNFFQIRTDTCKYRSALFDFLMDWLMIWFFICLFLDYPFVFKWFRIKRSADPESAERREPMGRWVGCRNVGRADGRMCEGVLQGDPTHTDRLTAPKRYYVTLA